MVLSQRISRSSVHIGFTELVLGGVGVICGGIAKSKLSSGAVGVSIGLWAAYFAALGILCIAAGLTRNVRLLGIALVAHIFGIIIAAVGLVIAAVYWAFLNTCAGSIVFGVPTPGVCVCGVIDDLTKYDISCSALKVLRNVTAVATIVYLILTITSLVGCIYGCIGVCCAPKEPRTVVVTTTAPVQPQTRPLIMTNIFRKKTAS